jgi:excisionase family DNA binding protein
MNELLTTREVRDLLRVDRITIYRMLDQGRLPGFKVGGQWRFSRREIEGWLDAQREATELAETASERDASLEDSPFPLHCVQNMQDIFADALDVAAVTTDLAGQPLTEVSNSSEFCSLILSSPEGHRRCMQCWRPQNGSPVPLPRFRRCHAGLLCASVPVVVGGEIAAGFACCQFLAEDSADALEPWGSTLDTVAVRLELDRAELRAASRSVRALSSAEQARLSRLLKRMALTLSEIGQERSALLGRLQSIAEMTKL